MHQFKPVLPAPTLALPQSTTKLYTSTIYLPPLSSVIKFKAGRYLHLGGYNLTVLRQLV